MKEAVMPDQAPEIRSVSAPDGARLEYEIVGDGAPLVMLHGILAGRSSFSRQRAELSQHYRLIMVSARGHDGSENRLPANYGAGASGIDDLCTVLDAEGLDKVNLFGHSAGGVTAFVFACRFPDRVERLVLIEPTLLPILPAEERAAVMASHEAIAAAATAGGPEAGVRALLASVGGKAWTSLDAEVQAKRLRALAASAPMVGPHARGLLELAVTEEDVRSLRPPTVLFHGTKSPAFESVIANRIRLLRPDLRVIIAEGAGHNVHRDRPDIINAEVLAFLAG
jgi:pimeloyl-ACP methyl ester carboxylesterase